MLIVALFLNDSKSQDYPILQMSDTKKKIMEPYKVLLVDDDPVSTFITRRILESEGREIIIKEFFNSRDAFRYLATGSPEDMPDIVLLDINMPIFNGWRFLESVQENHLALDVVMLSSSLDSVEREKALDFPFVIDYMTKPFSIKNGRTIFNLLESKIKQVS